MTFYEWREYYCVLHPIESNPYAGESYELIIVPDHQKPRWRLCAANIANKAIFKAMQDSRGKI